MQTFLPYPDFQKSASVLDNMSLGKQRVEVLQILRALNDPSYGWQNHPAVNMWRGYTDALVEYGLRICDEWVVERRFDDSCFMKIAHFRTKEYAYSDHYPYFIGDEQVHLSHQSNLIRKYPEHYRPIFGDSVPDNLPYIWPTQTEKIA